MNVGQLFKKPAPGKTKALPAQVFAPEQAAANRELFRQEIGEPFEKAANEYFQEFWIKNTVRRWLLPTETWRDLTDVQIDFVLKYLGWFKWQIAKIKELHDDEILL